MIRPVAGVFVGGDPELFVSKGGDIIGSERVLPLEGLKPGTSIKSTVILDGVQIELNPPARNSIQLLGREIATALEILDRQLRKYPGVELDWRGMVEVRRDELNSLSPATRLLGCMPSKNIYGERPLTVDPRTYNKRSAGGHLHFGLPQLLKNYHEETVVPFDLLVGNTCVLLDRDPGAAERRENYGRAGEYRSPAYGVEYRTLSNFWLRNYSLMSLVYGLGKIALSMVQMRLQGSQIELELVKNININKVREAIDTNNWKLAMENFQVIGGFLKKHLPERGFVLTPSTVDKLATLGEQVNSRGLQAVFPVDPIQAWTKHRRIEFTEFINTI